MIFNELLSEYKNLPMFLYFTDYEQTYISTDLTQNRICN